MVIDSEALAEAFDKVSKERIMKEIHEWIIYTAPLNVHEIYRTYLELIEKKQQEELFSDN